MTDSVVRETTGSWLSRARSDAGQLGSVPTPSATLAGGLASGDVDGWDPWEVWLRHIDQRRRRLAGLRVRITA